MTSSFVAAGTSSAMMRTRRRCEFVEHGLSRASGAKTRSVRPGIGMRMKSGDESPHSKIRGNGLDRMSIFDPAMTVSKVNLGLGQVARCQGRVQWIEIEGAPRRRN